MELNWSVVNEEIRKFCGHLRSNNLTKVRDALKKLDNIFDLMPSNVDRKQLADKLAELNFVESVKIIFVNLDIQNQSSRELADETLARAMVLLTSLTNHSPTICQIAVENCIHEFIVNKVKENATFPGSEDRLAEVPRFRNKIARLGLCVLMNMMRLHPDSRQKIQATGIQDNLVQLKSSDEPPKRLYAIMTLCLLSEGAGNPDLIKVENIDIKVFLSGMLSKAMSDTATNSMFARFAPPGFPEMQTSSITADEVFQCLSVLAVNKDNAVELIKQGVVSQCETYLKFVSDESALEQGELSPHGMNNGVKWALSLLKRLKLSVPECRFLFTFQDVLTKLRDHPNDDISQIASDLTGS